MVGDMLSGFRVLGFDLETTGLDARKERIVQYALIGSDIDGSHINLTSLVNPRKLIPVESTRIHGISDDDVRGAGSFETHAKQICDLIEGSVIVGHNVARFDWRFLELECMRAGFEPPIPRAIIDTLAIARKLRIPGKHALGPLCARFDISIDRAHTADADAGASLLLLWSMMKNYPNNFRGSIDDLEDMVIGNKLDNNMGPGIQDLEPIQGTNGRLRMSEDGVVVAFGKHRGRTLKELEKIDQRYVDWLCSPSSPIPSKIVSELVRNERE